jgi:hypothetical protein
MAGRAHLYLGRAGQLAVMAEFLARGWNVAVPEVDVGDDIFVVRDLDGTLFRVQVKTGAARERKGGVTVTFSLAHDQLTSPLVPELTYVFAVRQAEAWSAFILIDRLALEEEHRVSGAGSLSKQGKVIFNMALKGSSVLCSGQDFSGYLADWGKWPIIPHGRA